MNNNMKGKEQLLKDLQQLQKSQNPPSYLLNIGFNQKRKRQSTKLKLPSSDISALVRQQQSLLKDIREIDNLLQKKHRSLHYHRGYLFTQGIVHKLPIHFATLISHGTETVQNGFALWRVEEGEGAVKLVSGKLGHSPPGFGKRLAEKSLQKLQQYSSKKLEQSNKQMPRQWQYFSRPKQRHLRVKTEMEEKSSLAHMSQLGKKDRTNQSQVRNPSKIRRKFTNYNDQTMLESRVDSLLELVENKGRKKSLKKEVFDKKSLIKMRYQTVAELEPMITKEKGFTFQGAKPEPTGEQIQKMLLKENRIIAIWSPPSSYAQLMAVLSIQLQEKQVGLKTCWIKKYFILRHSINKRFFPCLMDWLSKHFGHIDEIVLSSTKQIYKDIFSGFGWRIVCWLNEEKVRISYRRAQL